MDTSDSIRRSRPLLGTFVEITAAGAARSDMERAIELAFATVAQVHSLMSFHDLESDVSRLNRGASARPVRVHPWTFQVLKTAAELHFRSTGVFDITVAPVLQKMGLLPHLRDDRSSTWMGMPKAEAIRFLPGHRIQFLHPNVRIDLGGIAKGFAVDRAVEVLQGQGIPSGTVNAGGDLSAFGPDSHMADIRDPRNPHRLMCRMKVDNEALASSGARFDPFQSWDPRGSAIIDPSTQDSVRMIIGATVRAPSCMVADSLTKIVMIAGESAATVLDHYHASALLVLAGGDIRVTSDWQSAVHLAA
jgi:thiamine biosynthesis lipoprotein